MLILIIAGGPDKGRIYELTDGAPIVLGREGDQVKLNDRKVSREHARLWSEGGQWYLEDLGSRHGTYRNHAQLEKGQRAKLKDGDYLQIGTTVMVLGRMPAAQAEKVSLLASQAQAVPVKRSRVPMVVAGVSVAALLGLGGYLAMQLDELRDETVPREEFARLQQDLIEAQKQSADRITESIDRQGGVSRELLSRHEELAGTLSQTNTALSRHGEAIAEATDKIEGVADPLVAGLDRINSSAAAQQQAIEKIGDMLAQQQADDKSPQLLAAVTQMRSLLADQPGADTLVARLEAAIEANAGAAGEAVQLALAEHREAAKQDAVASAQSTEQLVERVMGALASVPSREQIAEDIRVAVAEASAKDEQFMRMVLAELRQTGERIRTGVTAAVDEGAEQDLDRMRKVVAEQIAMELRSIDNESAAKSAALLEQVLEKVSAQQALSDQIASLRKQIESLPGNNEQAVRAVLDRLNEQDRNSTAMLKSIAELRAAMPDDLPGQLDQVLAKLDKQVRTEQITEAIERSMQRVAAAKDEQTLAAIEAFSTRLEAMPSAEDLAEMTKSQASLAELLDQSDAREVIGELRASLELLAERTDASPDDRLSKIIKMLEQREKAELMLAELHDAMTSQSGQTQALRGELLSAIQSSQASETGETLRELLSIVQDRLATDDSVRQAIRDELRGTILPNQKAINDARDVTTTAAADAGQDSVASSALKSRRLTRLESAYKQSFESGEAVTVGAGIVDAQTGEVSEGRLIDPAVAKALGFETWRDWYLTDRHARQMRLQQEAMRQRNASDAKQGGTIKLPPAEVEPEAALPEQD